MAKMDIKRKSVYFVFKKRPNDNITIELKAKEEMFWGDTYKIKCLICNKESKVSIRGHECIVIDQCKHLVGAYFEVEFIK